MTELLWYDFYQLTCAGRVLQGRGSCECGNVRRWTTSRAARVGWEVPLSAQSALLVLPRAQGTSPPHVSARLPTAQPPTVQELPTASVDQPPPPPRAFLEGSKELCEGRWRLISGASAQALIITIVIITIVIQLIIVEVRMSSSVAR